MQKDYIALILNTLSVSPGWINFSQIDISPSCLLTPSPEHRRPGAPPRNPVTSDEQGRLKP
uniref:Uncharacterized protein n=1 Tax=Arundo donax TaxID=35708 RepID=A0A0A8ZTZ6_ARUDO